MLYYVVFLSGWAVGHTKSCEVHHALTAEELYRSKESWIIHSFPKIQQSLDSNIETIQSIIINLYISYGHKVLQQREMSLKASFFSLALLQDVSLTWKLLGAAESFGRFFSSTDEVTVCRQKGV